MANSILDKGECVDGKYTVRLFIKKGSHAETYRVKDEEGHTRFLKLFQLSKLHRTQFDTEGSIKEIEFLKETEHYNIVQYRDSGEWLKGTERFAYLILDYVSGETLEERLKREHVLPVHEVRRIVLDVLDALMELHGGEKPIVHNDINHQNVMLDLSNDVPSAKLIDFGYSRYFHNSTKVYYREGLNPYYLAPECFNSIFSPQSDLFSVGALIYQLICGVPPWSMNVSDYKKDHTDFEELLLEERTKPLKIISVNDNSVPDPAKDQLLMIAQKAMHHNSDIRFKTAEEMLKAVNGEIEITPISSQAVTAPSDQKPSAPQKKKGNGFADIAGMDELKEILYNDVIRALQEKELYAEYGLTIPNGMLLYGPPGCGKSFFAEKLSEEAGYNYVEVKPSDLASIFVSGTQEKIGKLFDEARANAPTILNFEEFDALVPDRNSFAAKTKAANVNEFLAQMNNCGEDGVFVIGSTNQPGLIDPAVLRAGRIDKTVYLPPPDFKARKEMFKLILEKRPVDIGIDYDLLAEKTENYPSVDIKHLVNEASRAALVNKSKITQEILVHTIDNTKPTVKASEIKKYEHIRAKMEGVVVKEDRPTIGFKSSNQ